MTKINISEPGTDQKITRYVQGHIYDSNSKTDLSGHETAHSNNRYQKTTLSIDKNSRLSQRSEGVDVYG